MHPFQVRRAIDAASATASEMGFNVEDTEVVHNSDRIAVRLKPCDVLARVGPQTHLRDFELEVEAARCLAETDSPIGKLAPQVEPRVFLRNDFVISFWIYLEQVSPPGIAPGDYARALKRIHSDLLQIDLIAPRFTDHVVGRQRLIAAEELTPELRIADRELIRDSLSRLVTAILNQSPREQLLHGEPHPGNVLSTKDGPRFIDLATCCFGPIEYDLAFVPDEVLKLYPGADTRLIQQCNALMWAMFAAQRWSGSDQYPDRNHWRIEGLERLRTALDRG